MSGMGYLIKFRTRTGKYGTFDEFLNQFPWLKFSSGEEKREFAAFLERVGCAAWEAVQGMQSLYMTPYLEQLICQHPDNTYSMSTCTATLEIDVYFLVECPYIVYFNLRKVA